MSELGKSEIIKRVWAASTVGALCTSREALQHGIDPLCAQLDTYDLEVWSILHEWEMCTALVKELEEVLVAEESTDKEVEMRQEKVRYDVKRAMTVRQKVVEEEDEDEDEPMHSSGLSAKGKGKQPMK